MRTISLLLFVALFSSCQLNKFTEESDKKFADQFFKSAIANIELYKIRYGYYPASIDSLTYLGDWDMIKGANLEYERLDTGYMLNVKNGVMGNTTPDIHYPADFWQGLGLRHTNIKKDSL